ncbi:hypothetical protein PsorP6_003800 [Peronosclerospora sorghi]|uniref:Uncharacterized protein n=1 Tax=Peronosclerospora sorghi TaxID=230839 RepID=A0ACC0VSJ9_9STRA|nr:hypothetical protein PsorP6_003800 [Peronosclerospora sorghi]
MDSWGDAKAELEWGWSVCYFTAYEACATSTTVDLYDYGAPADVVSNMPHVVRLFSGEAMVASGLWAVIATTMSPPFPVPSSVSTEAWAFKQTTFAAATFLYAAQVHGLSTCPMKGFDQIRVRKVLDILDRYRVPVVIALGHPDPAAKTQKPSVRLDPAVDGYDISFLVMHQHLENMYNHKLLDFIITFMEDIDKEISEMKFSLHARGRIVASEFMKQSTHEQFDAEGREFVCHDTSCFSKI